MIKNNIRGFGYIGLLITLAILVAMMSVTYSSVLSKKSTKEGGIVAPKEGIGAINEANEAKRLIEAQSTTQLKIEQQLFK